MRRPTLLAVAFLLTTASPAPTAPARDADRITVPPRDWIPEGLAWDPTNSVFYVSSIHHRTIFRVERDGRWRQLGPRDDPRAYGMLGLKVDESRRRLWACSTAFNAGPDQGRTALYELELPGGRVVQRYAPADTARGPMINDLVVTRAGRVYATDTQQGSLQTIEGNHLVPALPPGTFAGPNGIALSADEAWLFVADDQGISRVALAEGWPTGPPRRLPAPPATARLGGIDGLYTTNGSLIAIQNGLAGGDRILRLHLTANADSIAAVDTLLAAHPLWRIPTTGALVGPDFWYLANSQLDRLDAVGRLAPAESLAATTLLRLRLR